MSFFDVADFCFFFRRPVLSREPYVGASDWLVEAGVAERERALPGPSCEKLQCSPYPHPRGPVQNLHGLFDLKGFDLGALEVDSAGRALMPLFG